MGRPRVEFIRFGADGKVRRRHDCVHRHRFVRTANKCAKESTRGVPADGGETIGVVYDEQGKVVAQARVFDKWMRSGWKAETRLIGPKSRNWREVPRG